MNSPTVGEVARIAGLANPVLRNLLITHCYHELCRASRARLGSVANWCTFATWASKQAGQTIRGEDLRRNLERLLDRSPELAVALNRAVQLAGVSQPSRETELRARIREALYTADAFAAASDAIARGNRKVFEEIGREFARFHALFLADDARDVAKLERFCAELRAGDPPDGQRLLDEAFRNYYEARFQPEGKSRTERMLLANLLVGLHEQTRLQPEIVEALNASSAFAEQLKQRLLDAFLPNRWLRVRYWLARVFRRKPPLDEAIDRIVEHVDRPLREVITRALMTLNLPEGQVRLSRDLRVEFPAALAALENPRLLGLLQQVGASADTALGSGARDWAELSDRMRFIAGLFRGYHERQALFTPPFSDEQLASLRAGQMPAGRL